MSRALKQFLENSPDAEMIELLIPDMAGFLRGKRIPREEFAAIFDDGFTMPGATLVLDAMGQVADGVEYGDTDGDPDVYAKVSDATLVPIPWAKRSCGQALFSFYDATGEPYFGDSRHVLKRAAQPLEEQGLTIVMAIELEFYLLHADGKEAKPVLPEIFGTNQRQQGQQTYQPDDLWQIDAFLAELNDTCAEQKIPLGTILSEYGPGQFEVNLHHVSDPVMACDHGVLLKRAIKAVALRHGFVACFMAKPFSDVSGNGLHIHTSLVDQDGRNYFSQNKTEQSVYPYSDRLQGAVGGLAQTMAEGMAIFAPNANSYRRLRPDFYAPVRANWGTNHRWVSLRVPLSSPSNTRIEHRTSGADANPYLVAAMIVMGIHHGIEHHIEAGHHINPGDDIDMTPNLPLRWEAALDKFDRSTLVPQYLGKEFHRIYGLMRRTESVAFYNQVTELDFQWYLRNV